MGYFKFSCAVFNLQSSTVTTKKNWVLQNEFSDKDYLVENVLTLKLGGNLIATSYLRVIKLMAC